MKVIKGSKVIDFIKYDQVNSFGDQEWEVAILDGSGETIGTYYETNHEGSHRNVLEVINRVKQLINS